MTFDEMVDDLTAAGKLALFIIELPLFILSGFVISCLWTWFVVPLGLPQISLFHAMGLGTLITYMTYNVYTSTKPIKSMLRWVVDRILHPLIILGYGWVIHLFM